MNEKERHSSKMRWGVVLPVGITAFLIVLAALFVERSGKLPSALPTSEHQTAVQPGSHLISRPRATSVRSIDQRPIESEVPAASNEVATTAPQTAAPVAANSASQETSVQPSLKLRVASLNSPSAELATAQRGALLSLIARDLVGMPLIERVGWLDELASFRDRNQIAVEVTAALFESDVNSALEWTTNLSDEKLVKSSAAELGRRWSKKDLPGALQWVESLEASELKTSVTEGVIWSWAQTKPEAAYEWAVKAQDETSRDKSFVMISKILALQQPERAVQWAAQFPDSAVKREALTYSVYQWTLKDPSRASQWSAQIADEQTRERALLTVAEAWATANPGSMFQWSESIPDPVLRAKARAAGERVLSRRAPAP